MNVSTDGSIPGRLVQLEVITLAVVYPFMLGGLQYVGPAFASARDDIRVKYPWINLTQTFVVGEKTPHYSDWLSQYENVLAFYYYRARTQKQTADVTAFVTAGGDDMTGFGQFATETDKLLITSVAQTTDFRDKSKWPTWVTTTSNSRTAFRTVYESLSKMFKWSISTVLCDANSNTYFEPFSEYIRQTLLVTSPNAQVNRVISAAELNMTNGEYVVLAFLTFRHVSFGNFGLDVPVNATSVEVLTLKKALKCLLIIEPFPAREGENASEMKSRWRKQSREFDNSTYGVGEAMSPHPSSTYIAMMALAEVVEEIRKHTSLNFNNQRIDQFGGRKIAARFKNRTFTSDKIAAVTIDAVGERMIPMVVTQLDPVTGNITIVLSQDDVQLRMRNTGLIVWSTAWPVPDSPFCGFHGESRACLNTATSTLQYSLAFGVVLLGILVIALLIYLRLNKISKEDGRWWMLERKHFESSQRPVG
ncbi:hypothetical protein BV898_15684 [Hypsibius exemplaris]|uniref:Receptor ligand binding region domain-containing protein n=1 Tax=Hypsibius exemplaris TaxID=2072580 RepID=A0A9X6NI89_HYPEX|nr:hypothetical protein BV898_15684 [Hypsibius exemplaris]